MSQTITVEVAITQRVAMCDFCRQKNQNCFNAPNSVAEGEGDRDICFGCITKLNALLNTPPTTI